MRETELVTFAPAASSRALTSARDTLRVPVSTKVSPASAVGSDPSPGGRARRRRFELEAELLEAGDLFAIRLVLQEARHALGDDRPDPLDGGDVIPIRVEQTRRSPKWEASSSATVSPT